MPSSSETVVLAGHGALADALAEVLAVRGLLVCRDAPPGPAPVGAVWVAPDPPEGGHGAAEELRRFGSAFLAAGQGRLVVVVRSFASVRGSKAFPEASAAGGAVLAETRSLAARALGGAVGAAVLAVGLLDLASDDGLAEALAGPAAADDWVVSRQGRRLGIDEVGAALAFLLSEQAAILNGAVLTADSTLSTRL